jgi:hypothetical protein
MLMLKYGQNLTSLFISTLTRHVLGGSFPPKRIAQYSFSVILLAVSGKYHFE